MKWRNGYQSRKKTLLVFETERDVAIFLRERREEKIITEDTEEEIDDIITCDEELSKPDLKPPLVNFKDHETKETFIKVNNLWICKVCQKTSKLKGDIKRHK